MVGGGKCVTNYLNCTAYDFECDVRIVVERFKNGFKTMPKLRYKTVEFAGDYYY